MTDGTNTSASSRRKRTMNGFYVNVSRLKRRLVRLLTHVDDEMRRADGSTFFSEKCGADRDGRGAVHRVHAARRERAGSPGRRAPWSHRGLWSAVRNHR